MGFQFLRIIRDLRDGCVHIMLPVAETLSICVGPVVQDLLIRFSSHLEDVGYIFSIQRD